MSHGIVRSGARETKRKKEEREEKESERERERERDDPGDFNPPSEAKEPGLTVAVRNERHSGFAPRFPKV